MRSRRLRKIFCMSKNSYESVKSAIMRRIIMQHVDLISEYGLDRVEEEIDNVALGYADTMLEEIGSSDVSCWVIEIKERLRRRS